MTPDIFYQAIVLPGFSLVPPAMRSREAGAQVLRIAGQESAWTFRDQQPLPIARGYWQFERLGGCLNVLTNKKLRALTLTVCAVCGVPPGLDEVYNALDKNDRLAFCLARINLWADPAPLPAIEDEQAGWDYYLRNWRPGKPDRERWSVVHSDTAALFAPTGPTTGASI
jgi:hypothetical protein